MIDEATYMRKLEQVYRAFELSLDLDIAFTVVELSSEERTRLEKDSVLNARVVLCLARERELLVRGLRDLAYGAETESTRLSALKELGKTLYPKRFKDDGSNNNADLSRDNQAIKDFLGAPS